MCQVESITMKMIERRISKFENRSIEMIQSEEKTENRLKHKHQRDLWGQYKSHWSP